MRYTSKGYKIPELDDRDFWDSYNFNMERLDSHTHDGIDSERLTPGAIAPYEVEILVADWVGASPPFTFDFMFPLSWDMEWVDGEPSPVMISCWDSSNNLVMLDVTREATGFGVTISTSVKQDITLGVT